MLMCYVAYLTSLDLSKEKTFVGVERTANTERRQPKCQGLGQLDSTP